MVPIVQKPAAYSGLPCTQKGSSIEAQQCQERIQCLEKALGFMQAELDRLNLPENSEKDCKYDKISVLPSSMVMIFDWVNGNRRPLASSQKQPPHLQPRSDSFRAKSVAPNSNINRPSIGLSSVPSFYGDQRATSAPPTPATPRPFPPRR